ncbi:MAG: DNA polymerase IV [Pelovirga sp.]
MTRLIMHIDMNAFFAAIEQQSNPALRGQPVAVVGSSQRTIILTASYEARPFGVKTGMTLHEARQRCPQLRLVTANNRLYTDISRRMINLFREYSPQVEVFSVDEAFLDVSGCIGLFGSAERIAYLIKSRLKSAFGLTCSIGIAPNKLLAKLASDLHKPDGLTLVRPADVAALLEHLPPGELCGIGQKTVAKLARLGITTCGALGRAPLTLLKGHFGVVGEQLSRMGRGIDLRPVSSAEEDTEVKTVSHSMTLQRDIVDREDIARFLLQLSEMVGRRVRRYGVNGRTVTLILRYADFSTFSRQRQLGEAICRSDQIYLAARNILDGLVLTQPVRLLGVRLSALEHRERQIPLLPEERRRDALAVSLDQVNDRYGEFAVMPGNLLGIKHKGSHVISPAWKPEGIRNVEVL